MSNITLEVVLKPSPELTALLQGLTGSTTTQIFAPAPVPAPAPRPEVAPSAPPAPPAAVVPVAPPVAPAVPTTERTYTLDELGRAGAQLMDAGKGNEALALFGKFGISDLTGLAAEQYGAFATELRALGAKI